MSKRTPSAISQKEDGFVEKNHSKFSEACPNNVDMTICIVNGRHFPSSFMTVGNDLIDYRTDATPSRIILQLHARSRSSAE